MIERPNTDSARARMSIYSLERDCAPLSSLVGDDTRGWRSERNLMKCLNHLPLLRQKEHIAEQLGLHNRRTPAGIFEANYRVLHVHQAREITTAAAVQSIAANSGLRPREAASLLEAYFPVGHVEFHPSDRCNEACDGCTYGQGVEGLRPNQVDYSYAELPRLAGMQPRSILLSGGGEPTLYRDKGHGLSALIERLRETMPDVRLALITNGTTVPPGEWMDALKWVRISVDAATAATYHSFRGRPFFDRTGQSLLRYLASSIPRVGASFLFSRANIDEYVAFVRHFHGLVSDKMPDCLLRLNLSFRPLRQNPNDTGRAFPDMITEEDIERTVGDIRRLAATSEEMATFLRDQTNIEAVLGGNLQPAKPFHRCYYSQIFHIVRANGDLRPCFVRVMEPEFSLGSLVTDSAATISLRTLYIAAARQRHCDAFGCRQCHVNNILERGLNKELGPSPGMEVARDPFF